MANEKIKSRFQMLLDEINHSRNHMAQARQQLHALILDLEKAEAFMTRFREALTAAIIDDGGVADQSIEQQMQDYLPKILRGSPTPQ